MLSVCAVCAYRSCSDSGAGDASYKLVIASSADYLSNAHVFCGPDVSAWKDCEIPGRFLVCSHPSVH